MEIILGYQQKQREKSKTTGTLRIEQLEQQLEQLDMASDEDAEKVEELCQAISLVEEEIGDDNGHNATMVRQQAEEALGFFGVGQEFWNQPTELLSGGELKKVYLACVLVCRSDLLLLDEPTNYLDVVGLLRLRRLLAACREQKTTVLLVSHDVDLINDVATDVIHFSHQQLSYFPGNYRDFQGYQRQQQTHQLRQQNALDKQRDAMMQSLDNIKKQPAGKRGSSARKKSRAIESRKKKLERHGIEADAKGHRWTQQKAGTGRQADVYNRPPTGFVSETQTSYVPSF